jgi:hypothetical protein
MKFAFKMTDRGEDYVTEGTIDAEDEALACSAIIRESTDILDSGWGPPVSMSYEQTAPGKWTLTWADEESDPLCYIDFELQKV